MLKKIYSLLAGFLVLTACTNDEIPNEPNQTDENHIVVSFDVDVPSAEVVTKSTSVPTNEVGITKLDLIAFDASNAFLGKITATNTTGSSYQASIPKAARKIQFVANYDNSSSINTPTSASTASTNEYVFFAEKTLTGTETSLGSVELLRNWSKVTLTNATSTLTDVSFMIYNASTKATIALNGGTINIPADNVLSTAQNFTTIGTAIHTFEQKTSGTNAAFVIVKGKFNGVETYYKLDLSVVNNQNVVVNYDIMRNYWYKINILDVQRIGSSWAEVINPNKLPDNNITASTALEKYPSIAYGDEKLEVTKTTFVFTEAGKALSMLATYTNANVVTYSGLSLVQNAADISNVVNGSISMANESNSGRITANIKAPTSTEQVASFYVKGGNLQRKITLILRNPYQFENVHFYKTSDVNAPFTDGTTNKITGGADQNIWFGFTIPASVDASIFPLDCKIKSKTLYSVTSGVRIETTGTGEYYYVYTATSAGRKTIAFKTNSTTAGETTELTAEYFAKATANYLTSAPLVISGTAKYGTANNNSNISSGSTVTYKIGNGASQNISIGSNGSYSVSLPNDIDQSQNVVFNYTINNKNYSLQTTVANWVSNQNIILINPSISGTMRYATGSYSYTDISSTPIVSYTTSGGQTGNISIGSNGSFDLDASSLSGDITFTYQQNRTNGYVIYRATMSASSLSDGVTISVMPTVIYGTQTDFTGKTNPRVSKVKFNNKEGDDYGPIIIGSTNYTYTLPSGFSWSQSVRIYTDSNSSASITISSWINSPNLNMRAQP